MSLNTSLSRRGRWVAFFGLGLLATMAAFFLDDVIGRLLFVRVHGPAWKVAFELSRYGDWPVVLVAGLVVVVAGLAVCRQFSASRLLVLILLAGLLSGFGATVIRATTGRTRPSAEAPQGFYGVRYGGRWIVATYEFGSFPSGHTAVWAGLAGAAWFRRRGLAVAFLAGAIAVAWSRLALGCHHFSDVTASLVWGLAVGPWLCDRLERWSVGALPRFNRPTL